MVISKIRNNSPSFNGVRKMVSIVIPTNRKTLENLSLTVQNGMYKMLKADTFTPSAKAKPHKLAKMTQYFNGDTIVGTHIDFAGGGYVGTRKFSDSTKISYSATVIGKDTKGNNLYIAATSITGRKGLIGARISHPAYDKKGKPAIPTLKFIKNHEKERKNFIDITGVDL